MYGAYESELYRFDQLYRYFCESADFAEAVGWGILKPLRADIEAHYVNWYLTNLTLVWGQFVEGGLLSKWQIDKIPNQYRFFDQNVRPRLEEGENRRAFVVISDAFRYEAAQELASELNGKYRFEATLSSQLGVLPSYTALGMASLLPHTSLAAIKGPMCWWMERQASPVKGMASFKPSADWPASTTNSCPRRRTKAGSS